MRSGEAQVFRFHVPMTGLAREIPTSMVFPLALRHVKCLETDRTFVHHLARNEAFLGDGLVSPVTRRGATGPMAVGKDQDHSLPAVVRQTDVTVFVAVVLVGFFERYEAMLTEMRMGKEPRDLRDSVKELDLASVVVIQEDLFCSWSWWELTKENVSPWHALTT